MIVLAIACDVTVALVWPAVHEKTSHSPPMERWNLRQRGKLGSDGRTLNEIRLLFNALEMVLLALQGVSGIFTTA